MKCGSRHPKRAIGKALLHPMSNLIATQQVRGGDLIKVDFDFENSFDLGLQFFVCHPSGTRLPHYANPI